MYTTGPCASRNGGGGVENLSWFVVFFTFMITDHQVHNYNVHYCKNQNILSQHSLHFASSFAMTTAAIIINFVDSQKHERLKTLLSIRANHNM